MCELLPDAAVSSVGLLTLVEMGNFAFAETGIPPIVQREDTACLLSDRSLAGPHHKRIQFRGYLARFSHATKQTQARRAICPTPVQVACCRSRAVYRSQAPS